MDITVFLFPNKNTFYFKFVNMCLVLFGYLFILVIKLIMAECMFGSPFKLLLHEFQDKSNGPMQNEHKKES